MLQQDEGGSVHSEDESTSEDVLVEGGELHCTGPGYLLPQYQSYPATANSNHFQVELSWFLAELDEF